MIFRRSYDILEGISRKFSESIVREVSNGNFEKFYERTRGGFFKDFPRVFSYGISEEKKI